MATFVVLATFSDQGIKNVKQTIERADAFKQMATKAGATIKELYWTLGSRDIVAICEAPDDETATVLSLSVASRGNVRSETLRAFSFDEMTKILARWSESRLARIRWALSADGTLTAPISSEAAGQHDFSVMRGVTAVLWRSVDVAVVAKSEVLVALPRG